MNRSLHMMTATLLAFATVLESGCSKWSAPETDPPAVSDEQSPPHDEAKNTASSITNVEPAIGNQPLDFSQLPESDLARSSWENPFRPRLWSSDGWRINEDSMICESDSGHAATFLRPYRNVVIECRFSPSGEVTEALEQAPFGFEIRLLNQSTQRSTNLWLNTDSVSLSETQDPTQPVSLPLWGSLLIRDVARGDNGDQDEVNIRLTLTPNRLLVAVDGQMKINVTRPGSIRMADCLAQFVVSKADIELSDLRFEGD
ncbi:MAG: hypothetical protein ACKVHE_19945 [Planctomycetales bacterium]|jgi:hypothetical protein